MNDSSTIGRRPMPEQALVDLEHPREVERAVLADDAVLVVQDRVRADRLRPELRSGKTKCLPRSRGRCRRRGAATGAPSRSCARPGRSGRRARARPAPSTGPAACPSGVACTGSDSSPGPCSTAATEPTAYHCADRPFAGRVAVATGRAPRGRRGRRGRRAPTARPARRHGGRGTRSRPRPAPSGASPGRRRPRPGRAPGGGGASASAVEASLRRPIRSSQSLVRVSHPR